MAEPRQRLTGKGAILTGASGGLGRALAVAMAREGARLLLVGRSERQLGETVRAVAKVGGTATAFAIDLTEPDAATKTVDEGVRVLARVDILVNGAGHFAWSKLFDVDATTWDEALAINLTAPFRLIQAAGRLMVEQGKGGSIVNIGSVHARVGDGHTAPQCASKAGLHGLTMAAAEALRPEGVRVNIVHPGQIEKESGEDVGDGQTPTLTQAGVSATVVHLCSDDARSITGTAIDMFGATRPVIASP